MEDLRPVLFALSFLSLLLGFILFASSLYLKEVNR
jgi:hypothetical protein